MDRHGDGALPWGAVCGCAQQRSLACLPFYCFGSPSSADPYMSELWGRLEVLNNAARPLRRQVWA